ncbi:MAG: hypothetical protein C0519_16425 [Hyphomicrobium sp.]|nr:hypothetical protein [Hyphomicrobium sp.]
MASDRQIAANRRNALLSTGPRTEAGKANSRRNALDHGLRAEQLLLDGEDPVVFEMLRDELFEEFAPVTAYEVQLVDRLTSLVWRLRRVAEFETAILKWMDYRQAVMHDREPHDTAAQPTSLLRARAYKGLVPANDADTGAVRDQLRLGRLLEAEMNKNLTAKLGRYEDHLMRQLRATRTELTEHQVARAAREAKEPEPSAAVTPTPTASIAAKAPDVI